MSEDVDKILLFISAAFHLSVQPDPNGEDPLTNGAEGSDILKMSHGVSTHQLQHKVVIHSLPRSP